MASSQTTNYALPQWAKSDRIQMSDFNAAMSTIDAALAATGNCRMVCGTYTGTGTCGSGSPNTLTFDFSPRIVLLNTGEVSPYNSIPRYYALVYPAARTGFDQNDMGSVTWGEYSVSWYNSSVYTQFNQSGVVYSYIALGI